MPVKRAEKTSMQARAHDFKEVNTGYTASQAAFESERCLRCQDPVCVDGCPVSVPIPEFIHAVANGDMAGTARILCSANPLPAICGRVCPQESQCEADCSMTLRFNPVGIRHLERYVADWERTHRRSDKEMSARVEDYHHAIEEGVQFHWLTNPLEVIDDGSGWGGGLKCQQMKLGEPDASGRARPIPIPGSEFVIAVENVVLAIGTTPNPLLTRTTSGLLTNKKGCLVADEKTGLTSKSLVFAGGDAVTGAATVILAARPPASVPRGPCTRLSPPATNPCGLLCREFSQSVALPPRCPHCVDPQVSTEESVDRECRRNRLARAPSGSGRPAQ